MTDFKSLNIQCLSKTLQNSIQNVIKTENYLFCDFDIRRVNTGGPNFLGKVLEVDLKGETKNGFKEVNIFLKIKREEKEIILVSHVDLFYIESFFYNNVADIYENLQDEAKVPLHDRFKIPKVFKETSPDVIFLENLSKKGFKTYNRMETLPLKCIELAVKEIARLHGLSFVMEHKMPKYFEEHIKIIDNPLRYDEHYKSLMQGIFAYVSEFCDESTKTRLQNFIPVFFDKFPAYRNDKTSTPCALTHGDLKSSNILVRHNDGELVDLIFVDYQFIDYGCPLRDLFFILTANTDQDTRRNHTNDLKKLYYESLSKYLKYFNLDVETVYPRSEYDRNFTARLSYGLMNTLLYLPFLFAPDIGIDYSTVNLSDLPLDLDENTKDKVRQLLQDFIDWGYL